MREDSRENGVTRQLPKAHGGGGGDGGTWHRAEELDALQSGHGGRAQVMDIFRNVDLG